MHRDPSVARHPSAARPASIATLLLAVALLMAAPVAAHVPAFDGPGDTAADAARITDPTKSWVYYGDVGPGQAWYRFDARQGDELYVSAQVPAGQEALPRVHVLGPGLPAGDLPAGSPPGVGAVRLVGDADIGFEPFSPLAMKSAGELRRPAPADGTYYVVIEADAPLRYSMAVGLRESFTPQEWTTVPWDRIAIQRWGGVPSVLTFYGEALGAVVAGLALARAGIRDVRSWLGGLGAGLTGGSAVSVVSLTVYATFFSGWSAGVIIPLVFAAAAAGIGWGMWHSVIQGRRRWSGALYALLGVVAWAGLVVGPVLMLAWTAWPNARGRPLQGRPTPRID